MPRKAVYSLFSLLILFRFQRCASFVALLPTTSKNAGSFTVPQAKFGKRRASSLNTMSSLSTTDNEDAMSVSRKQEEAFIAVRACYRMILVSALVDSAANLDAWLQLFAAPGFSPESFAAVLTFWKLGLAGGLKYASDRYKKTGKAVLSRDDDKTVADICRTMAAIWRFTAWVVVAGDTIGIASVYKSRWILLGLVAAIVSGASIARLLHFRETKRFKSSSGEGRRAGLLATRNMALCAGALLLRGVLSPLSALANDTTWFLKAIALLSVPAPFVTAGLLLELRGFLLRAVVVTTSDESSETNECMSAFSSLFDAQKKFYSRLTSTFKSEATFKVIFAVIALLRGRLLLMSGAEL